MASFVHRPTRRNSTARGFSLIEILLVLGLMALLASLAITNIDALTQPGPPPVNKTLHLAVREARYHAGMTKEPTHLRWDEEEAAFIITDTAGTRLATFPTGYARDDDLRVTLYRVMPTEGRRLSDVTRRREEETRSISFHPDHSATPFSVSVTEEGNEMLYRYDPFSDGTLEKSL